MKLIRGGGVIHYVTPETSPVYAPASKQLLTYELGYKNSELEVLRLTQLMEFL